MRPLRIGIIGCGEVTQIIHLPTLYQLNDLFQVAAICDVSRDVLAGVGEAWNIATRVTHYQELLALASIDAVLIANPNPYHAETTIAAMRAGKHVLAEKPLCMNLTENDAIIAEQKRTKKIVQVGTMRRYAPAFVEACRIVKEWPLIRLAQVHDIIGRNALVIEPTSRVVKGADIPQAMIESMRQLQARQIREAIGDASDALKTAYSLMLGLSTHDISAMREMLGTPKRVLHASQRQGGRTLTAAFDYGDYVCLFTTGSDNIPRFETYLQVYSDDRVLRVDYDTPFVRNLPIRLSIRESTDGRNNSQTVRHPGWGDAFTEEWRAFHHSILSSKPAKTDPQDFRQDMLLFREMIQRMAADAGEPL